MIRVNFKKRNEISFCNVKELKDGIYCYFEEEKIYFLDHKNDRYFWSNFTLSDCSGVGVSGGFNSFDEAMCKAGETQSIIIFNNVQEVINYFLERRYNESKRVFKTGSNKFFSSS